jgi:hypothetical protein
MKHSFLKFFFFSALAVLALSSCRNEDNKIEPTCFDEVQNQGETGIDCGGPCEECEPTCDNFILDINANFEWFEQNIDCGGPCAPCATCTDGIQNAHWVYDPNLTMEDFGSDSVGMANGLLFRLVLEQGIDCGYPCQDFCVPTCDDGIQNGDEAGVDCGGSCSFPCPSPSCVDGIQNGQETGVDCGAPGCPECPPPTCDDGIQNIHIEYTEPTPQFPDGYIVVVEDGIDCDNDFATSCPDCPEPTCFDGIVNQGEEGIDCGGPCPNLCDPTPVCGNGIQDGDETGIDCDDDPTTACPPCATCSDGILNGPELEPDCIDWPIPDYDGGGCTLCISCHDMVQNQNEVAVDCGGPNCEPCDQFIIATGIGSGDNPSGFSDQQTLNFTLGQAGEDTISVTASSGPDGLFIQYVQNFAGDDYLQATAISEFETPNMERYRRTLVLYIPVPEAIGQDNPVPMVDAPIVPNVGTIGFPVEEVPFLSYKEELIGNPNFVTRNFASYVEGTPVPELVYTYEWSEILSGYYVQGTMGDVNISAPIIGPGGTDVIEGNANGISFAFSYLPF